MGEGGKEGWRSDWDSAGVSGTCSGSVPSKSLVQAARPHIFFLLGRLRQVGPDLAEGRTGLT